MPNIIQVVRNCTVSAPRVPNQSFTTGEQVNPGSVYYWPLSWSGNATDTGVPWPNIVPDPPINPVLVVDPLVTGHVPIWNNATKRWETGAQSGGGGGAVTSVAGRTGVITLTLDDVAATTTTVKMTAAERTKLGNLTLDDVAATATSVKMTPAERTKVAALSGFSTTPSTAAPAPTGDKERNEYYLTALAVAATFAAPSGTLANGNSLLIRVKDNGTARVLAWNAIYRAIGVTLPLTTVAGKTLYIGAKYNSTDTKWDVIAVGQEA